MAVDPTDMRKSFDSLAQLTRDVIGKDPLSGHLFVFMNREHNRMKVLFWDRSGFCLFYKRLEQGTFHFPKYLSSETKVLQVEVADFALIMEGIELYGAVRKNRYQLSNK